MQATGRPTRAQTLSVLTGASVMLSLSMGMRQSFGLFMAPITGDIGISVSDFTLAIAIQNMAWGLSQPFIGAYADRFGIRPVTIAGTVLYALGLVVTVMAGGPAALHIGAGLLIGVALSCTAASISMTASARSVSPAARSMVLGIISAAGSLGTFVAAPLAQNLIASSGWQIALVGFIGLCAAMLPAAYFTGSVDRLPRGAWRSELASEAMLTLRGVLDEASRHRGYVVMSAAFFVCGLQLVFLTTHLPTFLANCGMDPMLGAEALATIGMFNVGGCYLLGWLGGRFPKHILLGIVYILRSLAITAYFVLPVSPTSTLVFAAAMGVLWLGVAPLVNGLVAQIFGLRYMATLTGIAFLSHQVGSFLGAWGGGLIYDTLGSYELAWQLGVAIGLVAGVAQMLMDDRPTPRMAQAMA
jgi:predicted MFS family arabinose efflux permease